MEVSLGAGMMRYWVAGLLASGCAVAVVQPANAQSVSFNVPAGDLKIALDAFRTQSNGEIIYKVDQVRGVKSPGVRGAMSAEAALNALLAGTGFVARRDGSGAAAIIQASASPNAEAVVDVEEITVTGSRIRGAPIASLVITQTQEQMRDAGQSTLAEAVRDIPQNFSGGQNPGVGTGVPIGSGVNLSSASTINLRGLGGDATLTLLNGHRLAYNITRQAIDISTIPFAAVDRIEIVADGASAIYGSDAVAGVANIKLKRSFDGLTTSARIGASTDGGNEQQQYSVVAGKSWVGGGLIGSYEFGRVTEVTALQRSYAATRSPGLTLYPEIKHHSVMLSGHQDLTPALTFAFDSLFSKRWSSNSFANSTSGNYLDGGAISRSTSESFVVAPSLEWNVSPNWMVELSGMYGSDATHILRTDYVPPSTIVRTTVCYCNKAQSAELSANGSLLQLPGGMAKVALGAGFRSNDYSGRQSNSPRLDVSQDTYYAFGELNIPVVSAQQGIKGVHSLNLTAAVRYEDYPSVDKVTTPKFGIIYSPIPDIELKGSWGKSFRAPTLYQQYNVQNAGLFRASAVGGVGYASDAQVINVTGGNPSVRPERATTWSATVVFQPRVVEGARLELSYFGLNYNDRIVAPILYRAQSLSSSVYREFVTYNPTPAQQAALIAGAASFSLGGLVYNPAKVVAISDNRNVNASTQHIWGVDLLAEYKFAVGSQGAIILTANASYLNSRQKLSDLSDETTLAGTLFNPPHFRGRAGASWRGSGFTLSSFVNYIGDVDDPRFEPQADVVGMTTVDITARYRFQSKSGWLRGVDLALTGQNFLNDKPSAIKTTVLASTPFDSTNYNALGRVISLSVSKAW